LVGIRFPHLVHMAGRELVLHARSSQRRGDMNGWL
jgi:hypothetical protein